MKGLPTRVRGRTAGRAFAFLIGTDFFPFLGFFDASDVTVQTPRLNGKNTPGFAGFQRPRAGRVALPLLPSPYLFFRPAILVQVLPVLRIYSRVTFACYVGASDLCGPSSPSCRPPGHKGHLVSARVAFAIPQPLNLQQSTRPFFGPRLVLSWLPTPYARSSTPTTARTFCVPRRGSRIAAFAPHQSQSRITNHE